MQTTSEHASKAISAERRFNELGIHLPVPPETFGAYSEVVFLSGSLPTAGRTAKLVGWVGAEPDAAVKPIVRLGLSVATEGNVRDQPKVADGASEFLPLRSPVEV